jgi:hypothetical protein
MKVSIRMMLQNSPASGLPGPILCLESLFGRFIERESNYCVNRNYAEFYFLPQEKGDTQGLN